LLRDRDSRITAVALCAALGVASAAGRAAVVEQQPNGFAIEETVHINAAPDKVYAALIQPQKWWNPLHTFSRNRANLRLDAKATGCLCENLPAGGSVLHATVVAALPGKSLILRGPLGPFQNQGVDGAVIFALKENGGGTDLTLDNNIGGFMKGGFGKWPQAADEMMSDLVSHLQHFAETGSALDADTK
jgi:uncharacterized protein YndB with AHSA1/START domain